MGCAHGNNEELTIVQVGAPVSAPSNKYSRTHAW